MIARIKSLQKSAYSLLLILSLFYFVAIKQLFAIDIPSLQLANIYQENIELNQYLVSEKFDGVRAFWNGEKLISRQGNEIKAPSWFIKDFPKISLDGELWIKRDSFEKIAQIIACKSCQDQPWEEVKYMIFDLPDSSEIFINRYQEIKKIIGNSGSKYLIAVDQFEVQDKSELMKKLSQITNQKGEGLMLRKKDSLYKGERNNDLIKLKKFSDTEGKVVKIFEGKGKYQGKMGAVLVEIIDENNHKIYFKIGSGFSNQQREDGIKIGSIITFKYNGKTKSGKPRFASFLRQRIDL